jgi:transaldolase
MPEATIDATRDHGVAAVTLTQKVDAAEAHMAELAHIGVDLDQILVHELVDEGVDSFAKSFISLLTTIADKAHELAPAQA